MFDTLERDEDITHELTELMQLLFIPNSMVDDDLSN